VPSPPSAVHRYHDGTKHHFHQFARSLGYLDWASQPNPFRRFVGAPSFPLFPSRGVAGTAYLPPQVAYDQLFDGSSRSQPVIAEAIGDVLRHALGLSAWKQFRESRWSLRVNPSSGNLHPTEAYVICGPRAGLSDAPAVYHYASDDHVLELRCAFDPTAWQFASGGETDTALVAITSIHWREAWKYGERAFRYCQHDLGHAVAAVALAAAAVGWRTTLLPAWSQTAIGALTGVDRDDDFLEAEREEPGCILAIGPGAVPERLWSGEADLVAAVKAGTWSGRPNQLSGDHVQWTFIDEIAKATEGRGTERAGESAAGDERLRPCEAASREISESARRGWPAGYDARALILQRRSAVAFDGQSSVARATFTGMLSRVMPGRGAPFDALWWTPRVHLAMFVHRVDELDPGLYLLIRDPRADAALRDACGRDFLWEPADEGLPLVCLAKGDCRRLAARLSCDQDIASDGFFSLAMIAEFDASLDEHGPSFYRQLFWESGIVGQVLYLEAEAAGARATGIGCFYDDPVHDALGLHGHAFQSLYHFSMGIPVEDSRLSTDPGYAWELAPDADTHPATFVR
jgi:SagB-type dehydrogenase family enzyme